MPFSNWPPVLTDFVPVSERTNSLRKMSAVSRSKQKEKNVIERFSLSLHFFHGNFSGFSLILASATLPTNSSVTQERKPEQ